MDNCSNSGHYHQNKKKKKKKKKKKTIKQICVDIKTIIDFELFSESLNTFIYLPCQEIDRYVIKLTFFVQAFGFYRILTNVEPNSSCTNCS